MDVISFNNNVFEISSSNLSSSNLSSKNIILNGIGLLYSKEKTPISDIISNITGYEYNTLGFWYTSNIGSDNKLDVYVIIFSPLYYTKHMLLNEYITNYHVEKVQFHKLIGDIHTENRFKKEILKSTIRIRNLISFQYLYQLILRINVSRYGEYLHVLISNIVLNDTTENIFSSLRNISIPIFNNYTNNNLGYSRIDSNENINIYNNKESKAIFKLEYDLDLRLLPKDINTIYSIRKKSQEILDLTQLLILQRTNLNLNMIKYIPYEKYIINFLLNCKDKHGLPLSYDIRKNITYYDTIIYYPNILNEEIQIKHGLRLYDGSCREISLYILGVESNETHILRSNLKTYQWNSINIINNNKVENNKAENLTYQWISNYLLFDKDANHIDKLNNQNKDDIILWPQWNISLEDYIWFMIIAPSHTNRLYYENTIIRTLEALKDSSGGFYNCPISQYNIFNNICTLDQIILYGALTLFTFNPDHINRYRNGILDFLNSVKDESSKLFYIGRIYNNETNKMIINGVLNSFCATDKIRDNFKMPLTYSTDNNFPWVISVKVHLYAILSLQPEVIDNMFNDTGSALKLWISLKESCGRYNTEYNLLGFSYTNTNESILYNSSSNNYELLLTNNNNNNNDNDLLISSETTCMAVLACRVLISYYDSFNQLDMRSLDILNKVKKDESDMLDYINTLKETNNNELWLNHSTDRRIIPMGWFTQQLPSIMSTSWLVFMERNYNPFVPYGKLLR